MRQRLRLGLWAACVLLLAACASAPPQPSAVPRPAAPVGDATAPPPWADDPAADEVDAARLTPAQAVDVTFYAISLAGTPYRWGGNTPESGFDCSGLIGHVYATRASLRLPRTTAELAFVGRSVPPGALRAGDLVLFGAGLLPDHAGIYVGQGRFVHAPSTGGVVRLDKLDGPYWRKQQPRYRRP